MMTTSLKVFVFAASGYVVLRAAIWWCKMSMSDEERMRMVDEIMRKVSDDAV